MTSLARAIAAGSAAVGLALALSACVPESQTAPAPTASRSVTPSSTPTPTASAAPAQSLPADCSGAYSDAMRQKLAAQSLPLNDAGVTLLSTEQAPLLELLQTAPTLRCTWGVPGPSGIATNITILTPEQVQTVRSTLTAAGFGCETSGDATICRTSQRGVSLDDKPYERGEIQAVQGDLWVSSAWVNVSPDGYTQDILSTVAK